MNKSLAIISGVSLAALIGLANVALAGEKDDPKNREDEAQSLNSTSNDVAVESLAVKPRDDGDQGKTIGHVDHGKTTIEGAVDDDGNDASRMKGDFSRNSTRPYKKEVDDDGDDSRGKKKDEDG